MRTCGRLACFLLFFARIVCLFFNCFRVFVENITVFKEVSLLPRWLARALSLRTVCHFWKILGLAMPPALTSLQPLLGDCSEGPG